MDGLDRDDVRRLAAAVLLDALAHADRPATAAFLTSTVEAIAERRRLWLALAGLDVEAAEAALRRQRGRR